VDIVVNCWRRGARVTRRIGRALGGRLKSGIEGRGMWLGKGGERGVARLVSEGMDGEIGVRDITSEVLQVKRMGIMIRILRDGLR
jgi:hypothetical protein